MLEDCQASMCSGGHEKLQGVHFMCVQGALWQLFEAMLPLLSVQARFFLAVRKTSELGNAWIVFPRTSFVTPFPSHEPQGLRRDQMKAILLRLGHAAGAALVDDLLGLFTTPNGLVDYNMLLKHACQQHLPTL